MRERERNRVEVPFQLRRFLFFEFFSLISPFMPFLIRSLSGNRRLPRSHFLVIFLFCILMIQTTSSSNNTYTTLINLIINLPSPGSRFHSSFNSRLRSAVMKETENTPILLPYPSILLIARLMVTGRSNSPQVS